jgi:hypothetical protein
MNPYKFVSAIESEVIDATTTDVISILMSPPGKKPRPGWLAASEWYNGLPAADKQMIEKLIKFTSHTAVFGFLNVIDGTRQIESSIEKGQLELRYSKGEKSNVIGSPESEHLLHELLRDDSSLDD